MDDLGGLPLANSCDGVDGDQRVAGGVEDERIETIIRWGGGVLFCCVAKQLVDQLLAVLGFQAA